VLYAEGASEEALLETAALLEECIEPDDRLARAIRAERATVEEQGEAALTDSGFGSVAIHIRNEDVFPMYRMLLKGSFGGLSFDDRCAFLDFYARYERTVAQPCPEAIEHLRSIDAELEARVFSLSGLPRSMVAANMLLGIIDTRTDEYDLGVSIATIFFIARAKTEARLSVLRLACLIEVYRQRHGRLPASLAELVPELLPELPGDPFSDGDFVYRVRENGEEYTLYSIGENCADDGGVPSSEEGYGVLSLEDGDIVFESEPERDVDWEEGDTIFEREPEIE